MISEIGLRKTLAKADDKTKERVRLMTIHPMNFTEFLIANDIKQDELDDMYEKFLENTSLDEEKHNRMIKIFHDYLYSGGVPEVVNEYITHRNLQTVRKLQNDIREFYGRDLDTKGIYVPVVSNRAYPLRADEEIEPKLYFNDVGLLTSIFEFTETDESVIEATSVKTFIVTEANSFGIHLYCHKDTNVFLCNDNAAHTVVSILISQEDEKADPKENCVVLTKQRKIHRDGKVIYIPVYDLMFLLKKLKFN